VSNRSRRSGPSSVRLACGVVVVLAAVAAAVLGFLSLFAAFEASEREAPPMRNALMLLGTAGAGFGVGISLLIWEVTLRVQR
jgi:hypothetical protein